MVFIWFEQQHSGSLGGWSCTWCSFGLNSNTAAHWAAGAAHGVHLV